MTGKTAREALTALGVIASLIFVGIEIQQNTVAGEAAAYQAIGVAVAESWLSLAEDGRRSELMHVEQFDPGLIVDWNLSDWTRTFSMWVSWSRLSETLRLQIESGALPPEAATRLGFPAGGPVFVSPAYACLWPLIRRGVDETVRLRLDGAGPPFPCEELEVPASLWARIQQAAAYG